MKQRLLCLLMATVLLLGLWQPAARAEDCFAINVDLLDMNSLNSDAYVARHLSSSMQGVRVVKYLSDSSELATPVRLTLTQMDTRTLLFDKDYGYQGGTFDSGAIYLPYAGERTVPYLVTLYAGDTVYAMPFMHLQPRLKFNGACTCGVRLRDLDASLTQDWMMGTMVDLNALRALGSMTVDVCASNSYIVGQADIMMQGDALCVQLSFLTTANVEVNYLSLYVITDCASFTSGDMQSVDQPARMVGEWVDVSGAESALIYLPMQLSYDPAGLSSFSYNLSAVSSQVALWNRNCSAVGMTPPMEDDSGWDGEGWGQRSGWDDGSNWSDGSEWSDDAGWGDDSNWSDNSGWGDDSNWSDNSGWGDDSNWGDNSGWGDDSNWSDDSGWGDDSNWSDDSEWADDSNWSDDSGWGDDSNWSDFSGSNTDFCASALLPAG